jgi:hypothetical protein
MIRSPRLASNADEVRYLIEDPQDVLGILPGKPLRYCARAVLDSERASLLVAAVGIDQVGPDDAGVPGGQLSGRQRGGDPRMVILSGTHSTVRTARSDPQRHALPPTVRVDDDELLRHGIGVPCHLLA